MLITQNDFTTNDVIDNYQMGDTSIDIVGFVSKMNNNLRSSSTSKFKKFNVNNGMGKEVQVIAWNNLIPKMDEVELGSIVHVSSVICKPATNAEYNKGNVKFELLLKSGSTITIYGTHTNCQKMSYENPEEISLLEAYEKIGHVVKIQAILKTEPGMYNGKKFDSMVASLTDCVSFLELKFEFDPKSLNLLKGKSVVMTGLMEQVKPGPPSLSIAKPEHVEILDNVPRVSLVNIMEGFRTKPVSD